MNIFKTLRKPFIPVLLSTVILFSSCSQSTDEKINDANAYKKLSLEQLQNASKKISRISIIGKNLKNARVGVSAYEVFNNWAEEQNIDLQLDPSLELMIDETYENNINDLVSTNQINLTEKQVIDNYKNSLETGMSFDLATDNFVSAISALNLSPEKLQAYYNFVDAVSILNYMEPTFYTVNPNATSRLFGTCLSASIGVGIAFVGLATLTAASGGLATGATVVGFIWASAEWGAACGKRR
jgi:hypothetical protein